ncbi:Similar to Salicylate biosynthesis protein pchB; acc. no. Q51507 [Pyronema omphalodes CBS 100304]|uniref:Similar to Salicylate biosynthesis protein pchB acc. no. Q51507 n=1 Tax=Pyronema omphalodes (strain CBS 100304) TaxID=1076935 RepID=U4L1I2_PYROM|nr:Similar to Salicylate biosynthesis protein pchB; acc. no. Q51507 [Pyronema omphalodes CBS 100304]
MAIQTSKTENLLSDNNINTTETTNGKHVKATKLTLDDIPDAATLRLPSEIIVPSNVEYPSPSAATTMAHVRTAIDDLDRQIVALLGKRMRYIEAAARIKPNRDQVRDQWRVDDVISKVKAEARKVDFPEELAEEVYAHLVEGSIQHEDKRWANNRGI